MTEETGDISYGAQLARLAQTERDRPAVIFSPIGEAEQGLTYGELDHWVNQAAHGMAEQGVGQGARVLLALPNSLEFVVAAFAAWRLGACLAPVKDDVPLWDLERMAELVRPALLVGDREDSALPRLGSADLQRARAMSLPPVPDRTPQPVWGIASGGSTGAPKLILNKRPGVMAQQFAKNAVFAGRDTQLICAPLYHTHGMSLTVTSILKGDTVVLTPKFDADQVLDLIERHRVTMVGLVATMLLRVSRAEGFETRDLSSLNLVLTGAGSSPQWVIRKWIDRIGAEHVMVGYGASENVGAAVIRGDEWLTRPGSVGRPVESELRILDPAGADLPPGEVGEIFMRRPADDGPQFEYLGAPPPPQTADGFVSVGDLGWRDEDGYLYIADRRTDMIKTGGVNVFPAEVEAVLLQHPAIADVAVIGLPDDEWGRTVHAIVVAADAASPPTLEALREHCKAYLAPQKAPRSFEFVPALPRSDVLKINRRALLDERLKAAAAT